MTTDQKSLSRILACVPILALWTFGCGNEKTTPALNPDAAAVDTFSVGGTVTGLGGGHLVLRNNGGNDLTITANGAFTFSTKIDVHGAYQVVVAQQPTNPSQTCVVTSTGTLVQSDVTDVAVVCSTNRYTVGGAVTGLSGTGLVLEDNDGDDLALAADGAFTFVTPIASGAAFTVKVAHQPATPSQACQVSGSSGTLGGANVTSVVVNCATNRFVVGGTVAGLAGTGLQLQDNGGDALTVSANGTFGFPTSLISGGAFAVTVSAQPSGPTQTCAVSAGTGTLIAANITSVNVDCTTNTYLVGGAVSGLLGQGLVLQDNLGDNLAVGASGTFSFAGQVPSGGAFATTVLTQPTSPSQTCVVTGGGGLVADAAKADIAVSCTTNQYVIGGTVSGLSGAGLVLRDNDGDDLSLTQNGSFAFVTAVGSGHAFLVTIAAQPATPTQTCIVSGAAGNVVGADVSSVTVDCNTNAYSVSGTVGGLAGVGLAVALNGGAPSAVSANGGFAFPTTVASGATYAVTVTSQPTLPWQTCSVTGGGGSIVSADVASVVITCVTNSYPISGTVSGVAGVGLKLLNGAESLPVTADGDFAFLTAVASGATYSVSVGTQPSSRTQTCTVAGGTGTVAGVGVTGVVVTCVTNTYQVSGMISGLAGQVVLNDNAGDPQVINANGGFQFDVDVASGDPYSVTVTTQPATPSQTCTVTNGSGTVVAADVASPVVVCATNSFAVGGTVTGLLGTGLVLEDNGGDDWPVLASGAFVFVKPVASGKAYTVTVATQPSLPTQSCVVTGDTGTVGGGAVTGVAVNCTTNTYTVGGTVAGLVGAGLVLQNNGANDSAISGNGTFAFPTPVASGGPYVVSVSAQPTTPWQTCSVAAPSGTIGASNVEAVAVTCVTNPYHVSVAVSGLAGGGLVLQDNGGDNLAVSANGTTPFTTTVNSGDDYGVTVLTQPTTPWQTCTVSSSAGVMAGADLTLATACTTNSYSIGGTVTGMGGTGLVLQDNAGDDLALDVNGAFTFPIMIASGLPYAVTIKTQPTGIGCTASSATATVAGANVTNVAIICGLPNGPAPQCDYLAIGAYKWDNLGSMTWHACILEAAKRGALLVSEPYTALSGWGAHRLGANAQVVTNAWQSLVTMPITGSQLCIVGRDPRATTFSSPLASTLTYDGNVWHYQNFGAMFYDQCQLLASNAGAMVITPYTLGLTGDNYFVSPQHACNVDDWVTNSGMSFGFEASSPGTRSTSHLCMVGFVEQP